MSWDHDRPFHQPRDDVWDHTAVDLLRRLPLALAPCKCDGESCERLIRQVHDRTGGRTDLLLTIDVHAPYEAATRQVYGVKTPCPTRLGRDRPPKPVKIVFAELGYATVRNR